MLNVKRLRPELEVFTPQTNGEISDSIVQNWTPQATECYLLDADCLKCSIKQGNYSFVCQMPKIVRALLKKYGEPDINEILP